VVEHLLHEVVAPGGHLIVGVYSEEQASERCGPSIEEQVAAWGFRIAGRSARQHLSDRHLSYRAFWIDSGPRPRSG
jgi:hypothetical protein